MPILNEERHLEEAVAAVLGRTMPGPSSWCSRSVPARDRTDEIAARPGRGASRGCAPCATPRGARPEALNAALAGLPDEAEVVVRVDGHGVLDPDYVRTAVELLEETGAANVGGLMDAEGVTPSSAPSRRR